MNEYDDFSDGFHTFKELYHHRLALTLALIRAAPHLAWRSKHHHPNDAEPMFEGYFIIGLELPTGTIRYHYKLEHWEKFKGITEIVYPPIWDGTSNTTDILEALKLNWINE